MQASNTRVLLIGVGAEQSLAIAHALQHADAAAMAAFEVREAADTSAGCRWLAGHTCDVALLGLAQTAERPAAAVCRLISERPELALVVVGRLPGDLAIAWQALRDGAEDSWLEDGYDPGRLARMLTGAVHRHRGRWEAVCRAARSLAGIKPRSDAPHTWADRELASLPLQHAMPELFAEAVSEYTVLLGALIEARMGATSEARGSSRRCLELARRLHRVDAGPRDVIELHTAAVRQALKTTSTARSRFLVEEARLLAIELMGNLAGLFRNDHLSGGGGLVRRGPAGVEGQ